MDYFKFLPAEIKLDIWIRLPVESVMECKSVCTNWKTLIPHQSSFFKKHFDLHRDDDSGKSNLLALSCEPGVDNEIFWYLEYSENENDESKPSLKIRKMTFYPPVRNTILIGSYDGLICLACRSVCVCNPITKECVVLPEIKTDSEMDQYCFCLYGFGNVSSTNEYKVVKVYVSKLGSLEVTIYTLGSGNGWRNIGNFDSQFRPKSSVRAGVFANGCLYWMRRDLEMIVSFDLAKEKFRAHISLPPLPLDNDWRGNRVGVLDGFLTFAISLDIQGARRFDIWLLKNTNESLEMEEQEEHQSLGWSKEFRVDNSDLLAVTKSGDVLTHNPYYLNIYAAQTSTSKSLVKFKNRLFRVFPHKNTFISLKELGEKDTKVMESIETEETNNPEQLQVDAIPEYMYL